MTQNTCMAAALLACMVSGAQAQNTSADAGLTVTVLPEARESDGAIGEIVHHNRFTSGFEHREFFEFETPRGLVVLELLTTPNNDCPGPNGRGCPDTVTVWELPEGVYASAMEVETPEMDVSRIILFEWQGM